jgi:hypothetical protein
MERPIDRRGAASSFSGRFALVFAAVEASVGHVRLPGTPDVRDNV